MSTESNLEERYIVFKLGDLHRYCSNFDISSIERVWQIIAKGRALEDKRPFRAVVIEDDLPEYEQIWNAIEARVTGAQPAPSIPEGWKLVPIELTDEMVRVATAEYVQACSRRLHPNIAWRRAFQALLSAAQEAKP